MSDLRVASISGTDGTSPATLVKQSAAKAWANLNGTGTIALRASFNIASVVDNGVGDYSFNWTNTFSSANYSPSVAGQLTLSATAALPVAGIRSGTALAAGSARAGFRDVDGSYSDAIVYCIQAHGDLA